jgi:adenine-specific DNA-methyltransferase
MTTATYGVKYIGSKNTLIPQITESIQKRFGNQPTLRVIDTMTGTTRVAQAFRAQGWSVQSTDLSWASEAYAEAFLRRTAESGARIPQLIAELDAVVPVSDWITQTYCDVSGATGGNVKMWSKANGQKADAIRNRIAEWKAQSRINRHEEMILVACLIFALDRVDNSVGIQQAYLKQWAARTANPLQLVDLPFGSGSGSATHTVANCLTHPYEAADIAYLDPPYSSHSYSTYYHIWDSITRWDKPAVSLTTNRRIDRVSGSAEFDAEMVSPWNSKVRALEACITLIRRLPVTYVLVSYNDESLIPVDTLMKALGDEFGAGAVQKQEIPYKRNIMSQIGNAAVGNAERGEEATTTNKELLIWVKKC